MENFAVDWFDTYTDEGGKVYAVILGSDYDAIDGLDVYDTIDLTNVTQELSGTNESKPSQTHLNILDKTPLSYMKLASGTFPATAADVTADTDISELVPGLTLPVQFTVTNKGTSVIDDVTAEVGGQSVNFTELNLLPNESTALVMTYAVPEGAVSDANYTVSSGGETLGSGTLVLNRPDVGISGMKLLRESDGERDIQITLSNSSNIPLDGSGKTVRLALYKDAEHENMIGGEVTIGESALADIDAGTYTAVQTIDVTQLFDSEDGEIPDDGLTVYAGAWVTDTAEPDETNNSSSISFKGLLTKYESLMTMDTFVGVEGDGKYTVNAMIRNNSLQPAALGSITADVLDDKNHLLASVDLTEDLTLKGEERKDIRSAPLALDGTPASVSLRSSTASVLLDAATNGGVADIPSVELTKDGKLPANMPSASKAGYRFRGWFTEPSGGEQVTADTVLQGGDTIYAQFTSRYSGGGIADSAAPSTQTVTVTSDSGSIPVTVTVQDNTAAVAAPTQAQMAELIGASQETGAVTIDLSKLPETVTAVTIPAETVKAIDKAMEDTGAGLTVKLPNSSVTFAPAALASIAGQTGGKDLQLNVEPVAETSLTNLQQKAVADLDVQAVYNIFLASDNKRITDFGGGRATVEVTHKVKQGQMPGGFVVWYAAEDGAREEVPTTATRDAVKFSVTHFSSYVIAYDEERAAVCAQDTTCPISAFTDADPKAWYHDGVHWALENGIMSGTGGKKFEPDTATTRAMIVTILWRLEGEPEADYAMSFADVPEGQWYTDAIRWAASTGVVSGYSDAAFGPNDAITREQLAAILYRYAQSKGKDVSIGEDTNLLSFADAGDWSDWSVSALQWAVGSGIINGMSDGTLNPKGEATRAQVATMLMRYCTLNAQ